MTEIDDAYQEEVEALEQRFFEEIKENNKRSTLVDKYRKDLGASLQKFEGKYKTHLKKELKRVGRPIKKKEKKEKFKHLRIEHIELSMSAWQRFRVRWSLFWFGVSRAYHKITSTLFPNIVLYAYYKIIRTVGAFWREFKRGLGGMWQAFAKWVIKISLAFSKGLVLFLKKAWAFWKRGVSKLLFWRKGQEKGDGKEGPKEEGKESGKEEGKVKDEQEAG